MINNKINVFIAGDENQSIYGFRGANADNFRNMISFMQQGDTGVTMNENFRADNSLLKSINKVFSAKHYYKGKELRFDHIELSGESGGEIEQPLRFIDNIMLRDSIKQLMTECANYNEIAVLCRNNYEVNQCAVQLRHAGIPVIVFGGRGFYKSPYVIDVSKILTALIYGGDINESELQFTEFFVAHNKYKENKGFLDLIQELRKDLKQFNISNFLNILYEKTCIIEHLTNLGNQQEIANLYKLVDLSREHSEATANSINFVDYINIMISVGKDEEQAEIPFNKIKNAVVISTIHKAKGLSFKNVIIPFIDKEIAKKALQQKVIIEKGASFGLDCEALLNKNSNIFDPEYSKQLDALKFANIEEELRVLFVAISRARERVWLITEKQVDKIIYRMKADKQYTSYFKWLYKIDNGHLLGIKKN